MRGSGFAEALKCLSPILQKNRMESLRGTGAEEYIHWGEMQDYHLRPSCAARRPWYDLGQRHQGRLAMHELIDTTAHTYLAIDRDLLLDKNFDVVRTDKSQSSTLCALMNSTFFQLVVHSFGRENFGGGLLRVVTHELANLPVVAPRYLEGVDDSTFSESDWDVPKPSPARRSVDAVVFDVLELTMGERDAVYEGVTELIENRRRRARSV